MDALLLGLLVLLGMTLLIILVCLIDIYVLRND